MEEKKKRFRPTLTAYRALENEVAELRKLVDMDVVAQNKKLMAEIADIRTNSVQMPLFEDLVNKNRTLEQSNRHLEDATRRLRKQIDGAIDDYHRARREVLWLRNRTLWQRITNAGYEE